VEDRVQSFLNSNLYYRYGSNFGSDIGASSSSAPPPPPTGFDFMIDGDTAVPPPWVAPPLDEEWAARASNEIFDRPAPSYVWKNHSYLLF
jgi:hypothetical protein